MRKPVIGITSYLNREKTLFVQRNSYGEAVIRAGGIPVYLPATEALEDQDQILAMVDGLITPGGADVDPSFYGQERTDVCGPSSTVLDSYEISLIRKAEKASVPLLGICRGMQVINVALGGTLIQDIPSQWPNSINHAVRADDPGYLHEVNLQDGHLMKMIGTDKIMTNSRHHQAVDRVAAGMRIVGSAADGITEAMENRDGSILAVQWHPELLTEDEPSLRLLSQFIGKCGNGHE